MAYENVFLLMIETQNGEVALAKQDGKNGRPDKLYVAREENKHLLVHIGEELLQKQAIIGYQVLHTDGPPIKTYEVEEVKLSS